MRILSITMRLPNDLMTNRKKYAVKIKWMTRNLIAYTQILHQRFYQMVSCRNSGQPKDAIVPFLCQAPLCCPKDSWESSISYGSATFSLVSLLFPTSSWRLSISSLSKPLKSSTGIKTRRTMLLSRNRFGTLQWPT